MAYMTEWFLPDTRTGSLIVDAKGGFDRAHSAETSATAKDEGAAVPHVAPFNLAFDTKLGFFPWLELPENRSRLERFGHAMTGTRQWETKEGVLFGQSSRVRLTVVASDDKGTAGFPWADLPPDSVLVDVGGGIGSTSLTVAEAHPHIKVVVEDRPQVVELAPSVCAPFPFSVVDHGSCGRTSQSWGPTYAPLFECGRMSFRARDLFAPWEPLASGKAPDVFLLRLVLHDWEDEDSRK